ncbi:MAG: ABC transporter ATP-binding protein [Planctomycetota bacterium]
MESTLGLLSPDDQEDVIYAVLSRAAITLGTKADRTKLDLFDLLNIDDDVDIFAVLENAGSQMGLAVRETQMRRADEIYELVREGFPAIALTSDEELHLLRTVSGSRIEVNRAMKGRTESYTITRRELRKFLDDKDGVRLFVLKQELECDTLSSSPVHETSDHAGHHLSPFRRFLALLRMDARDVSLVLLFAGVAGVLGLATPLAVESLVNVVSWGIYLQPLLMLALILLTCLALSATLKVLQTIVVEVIQRRQLVRVVSDLAHRFPRANRDHLKGEFPRELANRVFDIMTIQKATATLLLDGTSILLTTILGLLLLAFYHPFLLGFDIVLLICMVSITWILGRGGVRTAIKESKTKYAIAHWLQDIIDSPTAFRVNGGEALAIDRASTLATEYVKARKAQFRVVLRQVIFAVGLQVVASTALLGLGGWLVIQGQLTLGQLVASELVVTIVVGAFSKAGKSLEKYYDLMAGIDKVGHLLDIPTDPHNEISFKREEALPVSWDQLTLQDGSQTCIIGPEELAAGSQSVIRDQGSGSLMIEALSGLLKPKAGLVEIASTDASRLAVGCHLGQAIGLAHVGGVFHGSVADNVDLGRSCVGRGRVRETLQQLNLWEDIIRLPQGLDTKLQSDGHPLSEPQLAKLMLARAMAGGPGLLLIDRALDVLPEHEQDQILAFLKTQSHVWTLVISTRLDRIADQIEHRILVD